MRFRSGDGQTCSCIRLLRAGTWVTVGGERCPRGCRARGEAGEYLAPEGLKTLHMGQTEVTWSILLWTKHMLVMDEEQEFGKYCNGGVSIRNEVMNGWAKF